MATTTPLTTLYQFIAGLGTNTVFESFKWTTKRVRTHGSYWLFYQKKIKKLKESMEKQLIPYRNDLQRQVDAAEMNGDVVNETVEKWLIEVDILEKALQKMVQDMDHTTCRSRYTLGKNAAKKLENVVKLLAQRGEFSYIGISQPAPLPGLLAMPANRGFKEFGSTKAAKNSVMAALGDSQVHLIGIYGMGGVGKTTLMEEIGRILEKDKIFDKVVKVVVSQNPKLDQVRLDIAQELGLKLLDQVSGTTTGESAARKLAERLRKDKSKILIMLDDVWERLDLRTIGIPDGDECKNCQVLLTSRSFHICNIMNAKRIVEIQVLSEEDAWELFKITVGTATVESADIEPVARKVARECGGLPLALVVVGAALRSGYNEKCLWEDVWYQLKQSCPDNLEGVESHLFKSLQLSYDRLSSRDLKSIFLYCCLFREDYDISEDELVRYMTGEGFFNGVTNLNQMRGRVHHLLKKLKDSCLLLDSSKDGHVKMHDVVRDVAVYIASRNDDCFYVKAGIGLQDWPDSNSGNLSKCQRISLANNFLMDLEGVEPKCPNLLTLLLNTNTNLCQVPNDFFLYMASIRVLDLSKTEISALPSSITCLVDLGTLCLNNCLKLNDISSLAELKTLRVLSTQGCKATAAWTEVLRSLTTLKLLDLSFSQLNIPTDSIYRLSRVEELYLNGCLVKEGSIISEIAKLARLRRLQVCIQDRTCFSQEFCLADDVHSVWTNLTEFFVSSKHYDGTSGYLHKRTVYLHAIGPNMASWVTTLLQKTEEILMYDCNWGVEAHHVSTLAELNGCKGFPNVKRLVLSTCPTVQYLLSQHVSGNSTSENPSLNAFRCLQILELNNLERLKGILCHHSIPVMQPHQSNSNMSFTNLTKLSIQNCRNLDKIVIPLEMMKRINARLEFLIIGLCQEVEVIFQLKELDQLEENFVVLPMLKSLTLISLPSLVNIWDGVILTGGLQNIESIEVTHCRKLGSIFYSSNTVLDTPGSLTALKKLVVSSCASLKHLFKTSLANKLVCLESLELKNNKAMIKLIEGEEDSALETCSFPCLKHLILQKCTMLEVIYSLELDPGTIHLEFPSLISIKIEECHLLKRIPFGCNSAPGLKEINLPNDEDKEWFQKLQWTDDSIAERLRGFVK